jgi:hypothetical protein
MRKLRAVAPAVLCVVLAGCLAMGLRKAAEAQGAASVKPINAASAARSDR